MDSLLIVLGLGSGSTFLIPAAIFVYARLRNGGSIGVAEGAVPTPRSSSAPQRSR